MLLPAASCRQKNPSQQDDKVRPAGDWRREMKRVNAYYQLSPADSLQLKAARFLCNNLAGFHYYQGSQLDAYTKYLKLINQAKDEGQYIMEFFKSVSEPYSLSNLQVQYDACFTKAEDIIANIDMAFKVWREQPWGKDYSFDQFCEFILPFRIQDAVPENQREMLCHQFNFLLDSARKAVVTRSLHARS